MSRLFAIGLVSSFGSVYANPNLPCSISAGPLRCAPPNETVVESRSSSVIPQGEVRSCSTPSWFSEFLTQVKGSSILANCIGEGASQGLAIHNAKAKCQALAESVRSSVVSTSEKVYESNSGVTLDRRISRLPCFKGVKQALLLQTLCSEEGRDRIWIRAEHDFGEAQEVPAETCSAETKRLSTSGRSAFGLVGTEGSVRTGRFEFVQSLLVVSSIPPCEDILVVGQKTHVFGCTANNTRIVMNPGDKEFTVRAPGHVPKTVEVPKIAGVTNVTIFLEKAKP
jgi:hypothetical protein